MKKKTLLILLIIAIVIILFLLWWFFWHNKQPELWTPPVVISKEYVPADPTQQIIVWYKPGTNNFYLKYWMDSIHKIRGENFQVTVMCNDCDSSLMLLTGPGIKTFIQTGGGGGGSNCANPPTQGCSGGGPRGGGDTLYWCVNTSVEFRDSINIDNQIIPKYPANGRNLHPAGSPAGDDTAITVAVFDTGVDTADISSYLYRSNIESCLGNKANNGWNFIGKNSNVQDDFNSNVGHGKTVARFITNEVNAYANGGTDINKVKILPVKTHGANGESDLFSVLCGFAYAQKRGAKIINASFGYYAIKSSGATDDPGALLLKQYIKYYLTNNNILLIAAAGNKNSIDNDQSLVTLYQNAGLPLPLSFRDLDQINFYPASLAADPELPNVIAVTTVDDTKGEVSPNQNYSKNVVDVGTDDDLDITDTHGNEDFWFFNPHNADSIVKGSSYATPILTGTICAHYNQIANHVPAPFNKTDVLNFLLQGTIGHVNSNLTTKLKSGVLFHKAH